ncbi:hypothetical protein M0Q97_06385 [Candidatus Dojkabacteria bacterium]|jgi:hypothetical protein|nr:hypothetical protein [Candidatus Dojkabacteria bacterium]
MIKKKDYDLEDEEELYEEEVLDLEVIEEDYDENSGIDESETIDNDDAEEDEDSDSEIMFKFNTNNHKIEGKHALQRDTIFKGKDDTNTEDGDSSSTQDLFNVNDGFTLEVGSSFDFESKNNEDYVNRLNLSNDVYKLLNEKTELDFSSNRRKPNKQAFNDYYRMLLDNVGKEYTKSEIFVELSYYFTDNIFNMFKLLDKEYATQIIVELKQSGYLRNLNNINFI